MDALAFIEAKRPAPPQPIYVLAGDERFLKLEALARLKVHVLGQGADDFARSTYSGEQVDLATVIDELATLPFLAPRRLVIVQDADAFVTRFRYKLEDYFERPSRSGTLVLDVKSWKSNTRLARMLPDAGLIECSLPERDAGLRWVRAWLPRRANEAHGKKLGKEAADLLVELKGTDLGVLDQELAKLARFVGSEQEITRQVVDRLVGHSREEDVWQMFDAIASGQKARALTMLHHLIDQGQEPIGLLGALSWQLRRLAQAHRLRQSGIPLPAAAQRVGLLKVDKASHLLTHLGPRAAQLYDWLLDADLRMKSSGDLPPRTILERLVVRLAD